MRSVSTAIGITPVGGKPSASSSWRLNRNRRAPGRRARRASPAPGGRAPRAGTARHRRREEGRGGDVVVWSTRGRRARRTPRSSATAARNGRSSRRPAGASSPNGRTSPRRSSSIVSAKSSDSCPFRAAFRARRRALSPIASPRCAAGTHWLMIIARRMARNSRSGVARLSFRRRSSFRRSTLRTPTSDPSALRGQRLNSGGRNCRSSSSRSDARTAARSRRPRRARPAASRRPGRQTGAGSRRSPCPQRPSAASWCQHASRSPVVDTASISAAT